MALRYFRRNFQERAGVLRVAEQLNSRLIFRETPNADVGIDGYVEQVDAADRPPEQQSPCKSKSGASYSARWRRQLALLPRNR